VNVQSFELLIPSRKDPSPMDVEALRLAMPDMAAMFIERLEFRRKERMAEYVELLVKDVPMRSLDKRLAALQAKALERVYSGTEWLTAEEVGMRGGHGTSNPAAAAHRWKDNGQVFALRRASRDMYPKYAFSDDFKPLPAMKDVLREFAGSSGVRIASWFESTSSFLNGKRPRELVALNPELVIRAAKDAIHAEQEPA